MNLKKIKDNETSKALKNLGKAAWNEYGKYAVSAIFGPLAEIAKSVSKALKELSEAAIKDINNLRRDLKLKKVAELLQLKVLSIENGVLKASCGEEASPTKWYIANKDNINEVKGKFNVSVVVQGNNIVIK